MSAKAKDPRESGDARVLLDQGCHVAVGCVTKPVRVPSSRHFEIAVISCSYSLDMD